MWYMTEERELVVKSAREFAQTEVRAFVPEMENGKYPRELLKRAAELGFTGTLFPPEVGGIGPDYIANALVLEEIGKESFTMGVVLGILNGLGIGWIYELGTPEQIEKYVKPAIDFKINIATSQTEPVGVFNWFEHQTRAVLHGDEWVLNGNKIFTTSAGQADYHIVGAITSEPNPSTFEGYSLFIVPTNAPGFEVGHIEHKVGFNGSSTGSVSFRNVRIPKENLLGSLNQAAGFLATHMDIEYINAATIGLALAEGVYERTMNYVKGRIQVGKSLYESHQVMRNTFARMWADIECFRSHLYSCLERMQRGVEPDRLALAISCKIKASVLAESVASECINLWGGQGCVKENQVERYFRDSKIMFVAGGAQNALIDMLSMLI